MLLIAAVIPALTGCMPTMTLEEMKAMMPERPAELDKLAMFVGEWKGTGEVEFAGIDRPLKVCGTMALDWDNDRWCLIEHSAMDMDELGPMKGLGVWTYDHKAKKYRNWWFDSYGGTGRGTVTYDDATRTWKVKARIHADWGNTSGRGTMTFTDDDTMEWTWTERAFFGLFKVADFTGTSRRKK